MSGEKIARRDLRLAEVRILSSLLHGDQCRPAKQPAGDTGATTHEEIEGRCAHRVGIFANARQPLDARFHGINRMSQGVGDQRKVLRGRQLTLGIAHFRHNGPQLGSPVTQGFPTDEVVGLNARGAFVDGHDPRIAH